VKELDAFQADAIDTADNLKELAAALEVKGLNGGAAICKRAAALIRELILEEVAS
jgi:hypothetical protein